MVEDPASTIAFKLLGIKDWVLADRYPQVGAIAITTAELESQNALNAEYAESLRIFAALNFLAIRIMKMREFSTHVQNVGSNPYRVG